MKVTCVAQTDALSAITDDSLGVLLFGRASDAKVGSIGASVVETIKRERFHIKQRAWDLLAIALSVFAADQACQRSKSPDGWTRQIDLSVSVFEPAFWNSQAPLINQLLQFLTTDIWQVTFSSDGFEAPMSDSPVLPKHAPVSLLSGGVDSLIGAIDLAASGTQPFLISQVAQGDRERQAEFAQAIAGGLRHLQLTHGCSVPGENERSTRSRSIIFLAYGVLACTALEGFAHGNTIDLIVPENGFISVNPPLNESRIGGLTTRTTHPVFLTLVQQLLDAADLHIRISNPYQFTTKGEMLVACKEQKFLRDNAHRATSCGRFARNNYRHCGRCIPCLVRRAAFFRAGLADRTEYVYSELSRNDSDHALFDDVRSAAMAVAEARDIGFDGWFGTSLLSTLIADVGPYKDVVRRGLDELGTFLRGARVL